MSKSSLISRLTLASLGFLPGAASAQIDDARQVQVAAVSYILNFVQLPDPEAVSACVSTANARFVDGRSAPMGEGTDLDSAAIRAIPNPRFLVRPWSRCYIDREDRLRRKEIGTGRQAISIGVSSPDFNAKDYAVLAAEYWIHGLNGRGFVCTVLHRNDIWEVASCKETWIS